MKVFAIIPAAGLGTRMTAVSGETVRRPGSTKQFAELDGVPVLVRTLAQFAENPSVSKILVALRGSEMAPFRARLQADFPQILAKDPVLVEGGEHRQESVANALASISAAPDDIVLVHDAVRPFVTEEVIAGVVEAAQRYGAAIAGVPAVDTVKQVERTAEGALIKATIPREKIVLAQTPQGFRYEVLKKAFDEVLADGFVGTDEASLVERSGHPVAVVMGSPRNFKITTPADFALAEFYLNRS
jgi:2-C-methyl-D-erythritol 4-phosphate cytidylyltransferase